MVGEKVADSDCVGVRVGGDRRIGTAIGRLGIVGSCVIAEGVVGGGVACREVGIGAGPWVDPGVSGPTVDGTEVAIPDDFGGCVGENGLIGTVVELAEMDGLCVLAVRVVGRGVASGETCKGASPSVGKSVSGPAVVGARVVDNDGDSVKRGKLIGTRVGPIGLVGLWVVAVPVYGGGVASGELGSGAGPWVGTAKPGPAMVGVRVADSDCVGGGV